MSSDPTFDPYHKWLGIPPAEQPPNHYRLLGIIPFEQDPDVIEHAAEQRMGHLRLLQHGKHQQRSQDLLNEIAAARRCLLTLDEKQDYDEQLRQQLETATDRQDDTPIADLASFDPLTTADPFAVPSRQPARWLTIGVGALLLVVGVATTAWFLNSTRQDGVKHKDAAAGKAPIKQAAASDNRSAKAAPEKDETTKDSPPAPLVEWVRDFSGHTHPVVSVTFSPDGSRVISTSADKSIRVWETETGKSLALVDSGSPRVDAVAFLEDGMKWLAGGKPPFGIRIYETETGKEIRRFPFKGHVRELLALPEQQVILATVNGLFQLDLASGAMKVWKKKDIEARDIVPTKRQTVFTSHPHTHQIREWSLADHKLIREFERVALRTNGMALSPDGTTVVSACGDDSGRADRAGIAIWDRRTGNKQAMLDSPVPLLWGVKFSIDGRYLMAGSDDDVLIWDFATRKLVARLGVKLAKRPQFSPDGDQIITADENGVLKLYRFNHQER